MFSSYSYAETPTQKSQTSPEIHMEYVNKLITASSAAKRVESSDNKEAIAKREKAISYYQQARKEVDAGDNAKASGSLDMASKTIFEAVHLAGNTEQNVDKQKIDINNKLESVKALMAACHQIQEEKKLSPNAQVNSKIEELQEQSRASYKKGAYVESRKTIDTAYALVKKELESLRGGDTLVRSLNFATNKDEYIYELDRNDTHNMLFDVLLKEKQPTKSTVAMAQKFVDKAVELRHKAETQASNGNYKSAIGVLEESTKNMVRAIRGAGIYIPG
jgi:tetratricopeptide (TPR) repeat protein